MEGLLTTSLQLRSTCMHACMLSWEGVTPAEGREALVHRTARGSTALCCMQLDRGATDRDVKKAFRQLSLIYHPDKNPDPAAAVFFRDSISKAYKALTGAAPCPHCKQAGRRAWLHGLQQPHLPAGAGGMDGTT